MTAPKTGPDEAWKHLNTADVFPCPYNLPETEAALKFFAANYRAALPALDAVVKALEMLYQETADYITINKLGDVHHNQSMKLARAALALAKGRK